MAKDVSSAHQPSGFVITPVTGNVELITGPTQHLVVVDFNNCFIFDEAVLVHGATPPRPAEARLPGLALEANANQE